jgi:uncharacterized membrane protein YraQ (UPF0718 family)
VLVAGFVLAGTLVLRVVDRQSLPAIRNFILVTSSLLIEAFPFILFGALVGAAIEFFVPIRAFDRFARLPRPLQLPLAALGGFAFPVCECGSVPVARRLMMKGFAPEAAITFMLAAPILNPVVIWSTVVAYRGRSTMVPMVLGRAGLGLVVAIIVGSVVARRLRGDLLRPTDHLVEGMHETSYGDEHTGRGFGATAQSFLGQVASDFISLGKYLVLGASVAGALQTFLPPSLTSAVGDAPVLSIVVMMGLAMVLSLCSESDAFVAASFTQFGLGPQLAFLVIGPMIDTKLGFLYVGAFGRRFLKVMVITSTVATLAGCLLIEWAFG